jgi:hypothetical protein
MNERYILIKTLQLTCCLSIRRIFSLFIDDSNYIETSEILSTDLSRIYNWFRDWAIKFNPNKTESVLFTRKNNVDCPNVYFGKVLYYKQVMKLYHLCIRGIKTDPIQTPGGPQHLLPPNQTRNPHVLFFVFYLLNSQLSN